MSTETAGSGRPGEAEAIEAAGTALFGTLCEGWQYRLTAGVVVAAYPHIARALADELGQMQMRFSADLVRLAAGLNTGGTE